MLQLKNIVKNYVAGDTTVTALKGVSVDFRESEFVSILGPSGCGKTTLLNIIGGLDRYTSGDLVINNKSTKDFKDSDWDTYRNHSIGFVFQSYNLISHLNVIGNVELALSLSGVSKKERRIRALNALEEVGLKDQAYKKPNQLSGGQMQRVAIARALVNNPNIILADEPTGALDSKTSVQVMNILKKISENKLIIMVTHNAELANQYSNRIISMMDGNIIDDNNPFDVSENETKNNQPLTEQNTEVGFSEINEKHKKQKGSKKSAMGYGTALALSGRNLLSKKGRTLMTSIAGSIGIIGVALVLAISNGFTGYINNMQSNALGNHPITVSAITMDTNKFNSMEMPEEDEDVTDQDVVVPYNPLAQFTQFGHYNNFTSEFITKVKNFEESDKAKGENNQFNTIEYNYFTPLKLVFKTTEANTSGDTYSFFENQNQTSVISGTTNSTFYPLLNNTEYILSQYDLIYGEMPKKQANEPFSKEMLLVVNEGNKLTTTTLTALGFKPEIKADGTFKNIEFSDICNKEYKVIFNNDYYTPNSTNFEEITSFAKANTTDQNVLKTLYDNSGITLKISGVLRIKESATSNLLTSGIAYSPEFRDFYLNNCEQSEIAIKQLANKNSGEFYAPYKIAIAEMQGILPDSFKTIDEINAFLNQSYGYTLSFDEAFDLAMQQIGISNTPLSIAFYPKSFEAKDAVLNLIKEYNSNLTNKNQEIVYSDTTSFLTNTLGNMINIISYVLIAFASISLIVSSVMIGVLTYASVIERTKEIGVLRSIGARKKDISRVFNSETLIIGFSAGLIGILISYLFCPIINAIIFAVAGNSITTNIAVLNPIHALALIIISTVLTLISGLFPSRIAAKKDPVKALRTD